jgi:hypothetical protein|uniref:Uncharacterized protein n=1 Tax=viral metagenome TaxID=1070528 RepID=A0A6C0HD24_9ZZZZ
MFSNTFLNFVFTIIISVLIIFVAQYVWNFIKDKYSTKKTKYLVNSQIAKYRQLLQNQGSRLPPIDFVSEEESRNMENELLNYVNTLSVSNK